MKNKMFVVCITIVNFVFKMPISVGDKLQIYNPSTNQAFCIDITAENVERSNQYDGQAKTDADWRFADPCSGVTLPATISFTQEGDNPLKITVHPPVDDEYLIRVHDAELHDDDDDDDVLHGAGRRSRKVKKSKSSKKRPTARRRRSSKARKSRKSRKSRSTRRK